MADLNATVELSLASGVTITDKAGNALVNTTPTGTNNNAILVQNDVANPGVTISSGASDPVTGAFSVTFTFTEDVTGFVLGDIVVGNGSASNFAGSGDVYTADISPDDEGTVTVDVAADLAEDGSGNGNTAATQFTIEADFYAPGVTLSTSDSARTPGDPSSPDYVTAPFTVDVEFTEAVTGLTAGNFTVSNGTASNLTGSGATYTVSITPVADGDIDISLASGVAQDAAGFDNLDSNTLSVTFDGTVPTVSLDAPDTPTSGITTVSLVFSEEVVDLTAGDISVTNGTASNLSQITGTFYTFQITPDADGTVIVNFPADGVQDSAGNGNTAAPQVSYESDSAGPTVMISNGGLSAISGNFTATFTFSEDVTGFDQSDISVSGGGVSTFSTVSTSVYTALIVPTTDGTVTIDVPAAAAQDTAGNDSLAASQFSVETDYDVPNVRLSTSDGTSQTVNLVTNDYVSGSFTVDVVFSEAVTGLELSDFDLLDATASNLSGSGTTYSVTITPDADGDVYVYLADDAAEDAAGNGSDNSNSLYVINDETGPAPALSYPPTGFVSGHSFELQILWGEAPLGFEFSDLILTNAILTDLQMIEDNGSVVGALATLIPDGPGTLTLILPAGSFTDALGNANTAMDEYTVEVDTAAPEVTITSSAVEPVTGAFSVTFTFTEDVTGFAVDEITVGNGTASNLEGSGDTFTADITPSADGAVTVDLDDRAVEDAAGNGNSAATQFSIQSDVSLPSVVISTSASDPVSGAFTASFTFSESVTGFDLSDISVGNGSASGLAGSSDSYTADITPTAEGVVTVDVAADVVVDDAGNSNTAAAQFSIEIDQTAPTVALSTASSEPVSGRFELTVTFSENVTGLDLADISVGNGAASNLSGSGDSYTVDITPSSDGAVTVDIAADAVEDDAGNGNAAASQFSIETDGTAPSVTISTASSDPVSGAFEVDFTFSESVTGFDLADISVSNGSASNLTGSGDTYTASITPDADGAVTVDVAADMAEDNAGNSNVAASQFSIENDQTAPMVTISTSSSDPVSGAFSITVEFSESVTGFAIADINVGNGAASNLAGSGDTYTADITPSADGAVTVDIAADVVEDDAGNGNAAATQFAIESDATAPSVSLLTESSDPVAGAFVVTVTFSEEVTGFDLADITVGNGSASDLSGSGDTYTATITPEADGIVTVDVAADVAADSAGNGNSAADTLSIESDGAAPGVTLAVSEAGILAGPFTVTLTFSESVSGFALEDLVIDNGAASDLEGAGAVYTVLITPEADGDVSIGLAADQAVDSAGNGNTIAETLVVGTDATAPELEITVPGAETEGAFVAQFVFSESVSGFDVADIQVTNASVSGFEIVDESLYTATITPDTLGEVSIVVAADVAQDVAGNGNNATEASIEAVSRPIEVSVVVSEDVVDVTDISADATITNPGSQDIQFRVEVDVPWIAVDPESGTIPALGDLELTISVLESANDLAPGDYTGTVTVINETNGQAAAKGPNARSRAEGDSIVVEIPLAVTIEERFGTIQLVSTTPGGVQRDETFVFASSLAAFDGLELTTSQGYAASAIVETRFGAYDVTQTLPAGWRLDDISCSGDLDGGSNIDLSTGRVDIDLDPNESIVCTFNNTRDEEAVRLATMRTINNFMVRRADRILSGAPDLTQRLRDRTASSPGGFSADIQGGRSVMSMQTNLAGIRNHVKQSLPQMPGVTLDSDAAGTSFDVWMRADFSALSDTRDGADVSSDFGLLQFGVDWQLNEASLVGLIFQRDWMDEVTADIAEEAGAIRGARIDGAGWMAGPYAVWEVADGTFVDVMALWGQSDNTVDPLGLYEDEFETTRMMLRANITGEWRSDNWRIRPSASLAHFEETQDAYVDSLGIDIPEQTISVGRFEAGPEFVYRFERHDGTWWEPGVSLSGVWDYDPADLMDEQGNSVSTGALRAHAGITLRGRLPGGVFLSGEASFDGLGEGDFSARSGRLQVSLPF
nr:Ig-like domain-containing protein [Maricaulis parjimensis]